MSQEPAKKPTEHRFNNQHTLIIQLENPNHSINKPRDYNEYMKLLNQINDPIYTTQ